MGRRRRSREVALQYLYQADVAGSAAGPGDPGAFWQAQAVDEPTRRFAEQLIAGVESHRSAVDALLARYSEHWDVARMGMVDRNILRLGVYELLWQDGVPARVAINEAIEIAKRFGAADSGRFVNGILDRIHRDHAAGGAGDPCARPS